MTRDSLSSDELVPPGCRATVERLQRVLDGDLPTSGLDADPHLPACAACRQRVAAARLLLSVLAGPAEAPLPSPATTQRILDAVSEDRRFRVRRRRVFTVVGGLAVAASVVLVVWLRWSVDSAPDVVNRDPAPEQPEVAPAPRTVRIGDQLTKAGWALLETPRPITDSTAAAPEVIARVTDALTRVTPAVNVESPRAAIAEIPEMARTGLEPVTSTAQKAFARLMRDVGTVRISTRPKS